MTVCVISHNGGINKPIKNVHKKYINDKHDKNMICKFVKVCDFKLLSVTTECDSLLLYVYFCA